MFPWSGKRNEAIDHPMVSLSAARKLLDGLPDDAVKALDEIASWLDSITDTPGFTAELRFDLVKLLDETGWPVYADLLSAYLAAPHLHDFQGMRTWQHAHRFCEELARAYDECLASLQRDEDHTGRPTPETGALSTRLLRTLGEQMKLELMRYIDVSRALWDRMYRGFDAAESSGVARDLLSPYSSRGSKTCPQHEFLRALMVYESSPGNLAPDQIEVCFRIARRMAELFDLTATPDDNSEYFLDLAAPTAPQALGDAAPGEAVPTGPGIRYFGGIRALPAIAEIIALHESGALPDERRFGDEFTPHGRLTVLKHLHLHWDKHHPHRQLMRRGTSTNVEVVHGFRNISKVVPHFDLSNVPSLSGEERAALIARGEIGLNPDFLPELWTVVDASVRGMGVMIPKAGSAWIKVGSLCAIKVQNAEIWWVGVIRRMHTDSEEIAHAGIEILAKRSLGVWLRHAAAGGNLGSAASEYVPAILLPDEQNSYMNATLLLNGGSYEAGMANEILLGENFRKIELTALDAEGEDYELVKIRWLET